MTGKQELVITALIVRSRIDVETRTRTFEGTVEGVYASPYTSGLRATVVDDEGRVHNFYIDNDDCTILGLAAATEPGFDPQ